MRGHEAIIAMRRSGQKPSMVFINDYPCRTDWVEHMDSPTVCVSDDKLEDIDFRFLINTKASITAANDTRAKFMFDLAISEGASDVGCCSANFTKIYHKDTGVVHG